MSKFEKRLRRLEQKMAKTNVPSLEEVQSAFQRLASSARAKLRGESASGEQRAQDRLVVDRWAKTEGTDLAALAERARTKLQNVDGVRHEDD